MTDPLTFSLARARTLVARAVAKCETLRQAGTFVAVDASGAPVSVARMDGCPPGALPLVRAKAFGTAANGEPSARFAARMAKFGAHIFASYQAVMRDQPFPGAGGMPVVENGRIVGAIATGLGIGPFVKLPGVSPSQLMVDGKPANLEDTIISYALGGPYNPQHGDDVARWTEAYGTPPDPAVKGTAMDPVPEASGQAVLARALAVSDQVMAQAVERGARVSVAVVDAAGDVVTLDRMDGAAPMGVDIAAATATAAVNFGMASGAIASHHHYAGDVLNRLMEVVPYRMLALPGGYPIRVDAAVVGAIGVYGHDIDLADELAQSAVDRALPQFEGDTKKTIFQGVSQVATAIDMTRGRTELPRAPLADEGTVDFVRTGPGTLAGRYLRQYWQPIVEGRKVQPGRSIPLLIMSQKLAVYRSQDGKVHCVDNRCAHRGAMLSTGWVEGDVIRCPYHGWAFGPDGQCVHQPLEAEGYKKNIRIGGYPTEEYLGMVFVFLGEGEPPEFPRYPEWERAKMVSPQIDTRACNWFQNIENFVDEGHIWFTHQGSALKNLQLEAVPKITNERTSWGFRNIATTPDGRRRQVLFGMPNCGMFAVHPDNIRKQGEAESTEHAPWQMFLDWRVPVDDETHLQVHIIGTFGGGEPTEAMRNRWREFANAEAEAHDVARRVMEGELHFDQIAQMCHHVPLAQDEVVQVGQGAIADRRKGIEHLGASDAGIVAVRRLYIQELTAFAEGRPLTQWVRPEGMLPVTGSGLTTEPRMPGDAVALIAADDGGDARRWRRVRVRRRAVVADDTIALELESLDAEPLPAFEAGAHVDLRTSSGIIRQYSLCGDPRDRRTYRLGILLDPKSRGGSIAVHQEVLDGGVVEISAPRNHFPLVAAATESLLFAGGIGITR